MSKRHMLLYAVLALVLVVTSCTPKATVAPTAVPVEPTATTPAIVAKEETPTSIAYSGKYKEAPMLAALVEAGTLPNVEQRLPDNPLVTQPVESVGKYGGELFTASWWPEAGNALMYMSEPPLKWKSDMTGYEAALI
jgi:hypothetical protein